MTGAAVVAAPGVGASRWTRETSHWFARALVAFPERVLLLFLCAVAAVGPLTTFGQFRPYLVVPLFVILAVVSWRLLPATRTATLVSAAAGGVLLLIAIVWIAFNVPFHAELYVVVRDPAIYTLRALWLVHHASPNVDIGSAYHAALTIPSGAPATGGGAPPVTGTSAVSAAGFAPVGGEWQAQNATLVPALVAVFGWIAGEQGVLNGNLVIGAIALVVVYALGRRIVGPVWALAPVIALATSMPMVQFSRAPYTEPTALALGVGGVLLLWISLEYARRWLALIAGLAVGATFMSRPDGLLFVLGAALGLGIVCALSRSVQRRRELRGRLILFTVGAAITVALGFADFARNSSVYENSQWKEIKPLAEGTVAVVVVVILLCLIPGAGAFRRWMDTGRTRWAQVVCAVLGVAFVAMVLRPLYIVIHHTPTTTTEAAQVASLANRQAAAHLAVDGTRTYDERTLLWLSWYYDWPAVVFGAVGVLIAVWWVFRRRDARLAPLLGIVGVSAALYLNRVNITPDQVWAMRRFLPVVIPGGLVFAAVVPFVLWNRGRAWRWVAGVAGVLIAFAPIPLWRSNLITGEYRGTRAFVSSMCSALAGKDAVLADNGPGGSIFLPTLKIECGVPALLLTKVTPQRLLAARTAFADGRQVVVISFTQSAVPWRPATPVTPYLTGTFKMWEQPLTSRPQQEVLSGFSMFYGTIGADGLVDARLPGH